MEQITREQAYDLLKEYKLDGLPYSSVKNGIIASSASGASLVVAALSA